MNNLLDTGRYIVQEGTYDEFGKFRFALDEYTKDKDGVKRMTNIGWYESLSRAEEAMTRHRVNGV